jgi:hypothetical protein
VEKGVADENSEAQSPNQHGQVELSFLHPESDRVSLAAHQSNLSSGQENQGTLRPHPVITHTTGSGSD